MTLGSPDPPRHSRLWMACVAVMLFLVAVLVGLVLWEMRTSVLQARWLTPIASELTWSVEPGASSSIVFPKQGPYDRRLGYSRLPRMIETASESGFRIVGQASVSPRFLEVVNEWGLFPVYREKSPAGLSVADRRGDPLFTNLYPSRTFPSFESIPPVVWQTLLYIENQSVLDSDRPLRNPAVEWPRFFRSSVELGLRFVGREGSVAGASTLATQLEKFRHAPAGRTTSPRAKLVQMASASLRGYLDGPATLDARKRIVLDYLNSVPLAAQVGEGEVNGLGDGLWVWFGRDLGDIDRALALVPTPPRSPFADLGGPPENLERAGQEEDAGGVVASLEIQGLLYREVLSLLLSQRRPSYYLIAEGGPAALAELTDRHLRLLAAAGVISSELANAARLARAEVLTIPPPRAAVDFVERKGVNTVRNALRSVTGVSLLYDLDKLDLSARATLDGRAQEATTAFIQRLADPEFVRAEGFGEYRLLDRGDPRRVVYSVVLHESTPQGNLVRIETDNLRSPLNLSGSARLELGSTAKLRTLTSYLEVVAELHAKFSRLDPDSLSRYSLSPSDELSGWARSQILTRPGLDLLGLLRSSMERAYSANPGERFLTGGGTQVFSNFDATYDQSRITVEEGFRQSVNLVFVRVMGDVVNYYIYRDPGSKAHVLEERDSPLRQQYLERFADREGIQFLDRFIPKFRGKGRDEILQALIIERGLSPQRIAWAYRAVVLDASQEEFQWLLLSNHFNTEFSEAAIQDLFRRAGPFGQTLADLGYLSSVHPMELWVARHLIEHPEATRTEMLDASAQARQDVSRWLFLTSRQGAQDQRIRSLLEVEAFAEIHAGWKRLGYPFDNMVPSLGSAIGSSGDRPAALGDLVGIIVNNGVRRPTYRVQELHFAPGTPFETRMARDGDVASDRVMAPQVAQVLREALVDVVEQGTGRRMSGVLRGPDGAPLTVGGKTGTGDNRYRTFAPGGQLVESRSVNRTATFAFLIEDRFYGVVTAYVPGGDADDFWFTSALATQILRGLAPVIEELVLTSLD